MAGRPTKLTPETSAAIIKIIRRGNFRNVAAQFAGVTERTLRAWLRLGRERPRSVYGAFLHAVLKAEKAAEIDMVGIVRKASRTDARHAEWFLERKFPSRWGKREIHQIRQLEEQIKAMERELRARLGTQENKAGPPPS